MGTKLDFTKAPGLQLRITANGFETFSIFRRIKGGQPERITLDRFPATTVEQPRAEAAKVSGEITGSKNPAKVKRAITDAPALADLSDGYLEHHSMFRQTSCCAFSRPAR